MKLGLSLTTKEHVASALCSICNGNAHFGGLCRAGVGNRQSIADRIDCMILSAGHIHSQFENFVLKMRNITTQIY